MNESNEKTKFTKENNWGADEIGDVTKIKNVVNEGENRLTYQKDKDPKEGVVLDESKYLKFYELNEDGLKLYGIYKKEQYLKTLKFSVLGTVLGVCFSFLFEVSFKKMDMKKKDWYKTIVLMGTVFFLTYQGFTVSASEFKKKQNQLIELHGKEIHNKF